MESDYVSANELERIRQKQGIDSCKDYFIKMGKKKSQNVLMLINANTLKFSTLFILRPQIRSLNLEKGLNERNKTALWICKKIRNRKKESDDIISLDSKKVRSILLWMFETGADDDGLCDEFDEVLDISASVLIKTYHENIILPKISDLIFKRNRNGTFNHDLIWVFFRAHEPGALKYIADFLESAEKEDVLLARQLLHLQSDINSDPKKQYREYASWLDENNNYLYFTGESLQLTNSPEPCNVNLEAKYLCKNSSSDKCRILNPLTNAEFASIQKFNQAQEVEKLFLARCSQKLNKEDKLFWKHWMDYPVSKQLQIAKYGRRDFV